MTMTEAQDSDAEPGTGVAAAAEAGEEDREETRRTGRDEEGHVGEAGRAAVHQRAAVEATLQTTGFAF